MKYTASGVVVVALIAGASAQATNNTVSSSAVPVASTVTPNVATPTALSACAVQSTFELCLKNEDNYIKTCQEHDFACLCRWHKEKLTCWNNCPNDEGFARQEGIVSNLCSMPGANVSIAPWTSTIASTYTPIAPTSVQAPSISAIPTTTTNKTSDASTMTFGLISVLSAAAAYMLF